MPGNDPLGEAAPTRRGREQRSVADGTDRGVGVLVVGLIDGFTAAVRDVDDVRGGLRGLRRMGPGLRLPSPVAHRPGRLGAGDRLVVVTAGGGGHGNPAEREPWRVRDDMADDKISALIAGR